MGARLILEPYFDELQERFVEAGLDRVSETRLRCKLGLHDTPRHFAGCLEDGTMIYAAPELVEMPTDMVLGILAHELGHAADFLYPGEFVLREDHVVRVEPDRQRMKGWRKRDDDTVEITADFIAEKVLGTPIGYRGPCHLQSLGHVGNPRPLGLR
jgi:hypothetical protein